MSTTGRRVRSRAPRARGRASRRAAEEALRATLPEAGASAVYPRDIFISHARSDRDSHVRPLRDTLARRGVSTWVDEGEIGPGDSIVDSVGWGLERASCALFLITPAFLDRKWPAKELKAALSREIAGDAGTRVIVVIDGDPDPVLARYPLIGDKLWLDWADGPDAIADRLAARFARSPARWHLGIHDPAYVGPVWTRITPAAGTAAGAAFDVTMLWGHFHLSRRVQLLGTGPLSLLHHKTEASDLPLYVSVEPAAIVTVGQGPAPDLDQLNVDEGWTRLAGAPVIPSRDDELET